ncbi:disease resistance protein RPV1-like [Mangifera indica]|uniref:disease resistance protein RPV1-like n=1 Tax=Mangifera indica TaxID=29780 RepID=UPI001CFA5837|nr:disease resistance protein RPV1-like [Mangifera indica]
MASSSSSSQVKYDVFLSFRGEDTRDNFTSHLNAALCRRKIVTFIDDQLVRGDEISPSLLNAIRGSKISIIIFSKGYASSTWCLQELVEILDCKRRYGQIVIPVFYHVDPSDVRKQTGTYGDAFGQHEVRYMEKKEKLQRWRNALTEAANISGFDSNSIRPESKLLDTITECILESLNDNSHSDNKNLVGVAMKIQKIKSLLSDQSSKVCKVGLWGMGGIGKTTLAEAVFKEISSQFEASYFARNVREASNINQLRRLQKEFLYAILGDKHLDISHTSTKERLGRKRVFTVFDDVTDSKQIKEFIEDPEGLGFGSQIIITTRDKQMLTIYGLDDSTIYEVEGLGGDESFRLFKQHAFKQNHPIDEVYLKLSEKVISYTKGLPLALEVLGNHLLGRGKLEWDSALEDLQKSPYEGIQKVLKISYDGLFDKEKTLFLDIACFFKGCDKYLVGTFSSHIRIRVLVDKALISILFTTIEMHDLIQEMGWEIVRQESITKLGQRSRLWHHEDVDRVLKKNLGTDKIRGMLFNMVEMRKIHFNPHAFSEMANLRLLMVKNLYWGYNNDIHGFDNIEFDFSELECLCWDFYPFPSLPLKFDPDNLVVLKMQDSYLEQLWTGIKNLACLKYIDLSHSRHLLEVPDLSKASNLERLILYGCSNLNTAPRISGNMERLCLDGTAIKTLSSSIESSSRLVELNLKNCLSLESLPSSLCNLTSLRKLDLSGLSNLKMVPEFPSEILELHLDGTAVKELSSSIGKVSSLIRLSLKNCSSLESLPSNLCNLTSLRELDLSGSSNLKMVPEFPPEILELYLDGTAVKELSSSIGKVSSLIILSLRNCSRLEILPSSLCNLTSLRKLDLFGSSNLKMVPEFPPEILELHLDGTAVKELSSSIGKVSSLKRLSLRNCSSLESLPNSLCTLTSLEELDLSGSSNLKMVPEFPPEILELYLDGTAVKELSASIGKVSSLKRLSLRNCSSLEILPSSLCNLTSLRKLDLSGSSNLKMVSEFPPEILELYLDETAMKELSSSIGKVSSLKRLSLRNCSSLESLPSSLCNLTSLPKLDLSGLSNLKMVPEFPPKIQELYLDGTVVKELSSSIGKVSSLKRLSLRNCSSLESLPSSFCNLTSLLELDLSGLSNLKMVPEFPPKILELYLDGTAVKELSSSIGKVSSLIRLSLRNCSSLEILPSSLCNLTSLRELNLSGLSNLKMVPEFPPEILELYLDGTAVKELSSSIGKVSSLIRLSLRNCSSLESLPNGLCTLTSLEELDLSGSSNLKMVPEFPPEILELYLDGTAVKELSSSIGKVSSLKRLSLRNCSSLESLPNSLCNLTSLRKLDLSGSSNLKMVPEFPPEILELYLDGTAVKELSASIGKVSSLKRLSLRNCSSLESLPSSLCNLTSLRELDLSGLSNLKMVPEFPPEILELYLDGTAVKELSSSIGKVSSLKRLSLRNCSSLESLPSSLCNLTSLRELNLFGSSNLKMVPEFPPKILELYLDGIAVKELSSSIGKVSFLIRLSLRNCSSLESLPSSLCNLTYLRELDLSGSSNLKMVPEFPPEILKLYLDGTAVKELSSSIGKVSSLVTLSVRNCSSLESLPSSLCNLTSLLELDLSGLSNLKMVPEFPPEILKLYLDGTAVKELSSSIGKVSSLVTLSVRNCSSLESLPSSLCNLTTLRELDLSGLSNLKMVPEFPPEILELYLDGTAVKELSSSIGKVSSLKRLSLRNCSSLESLPSSLCNLTSVRMLDLSSSSNLKMVPEIPPEILELYLDGTAVKELSSSIGKVSSLIRLSLRNCSSLESLPSSLCNLTSLRELDLSGSSNLKMVPEFPPEILELYLDGTAVKELSSSIGKVSSLMRLSLRNCSSLESLPSNLCNLTYL